MYSCKVRANAVTVTDLSADILGINYITHLILWHCQIIVGTYIGCLTAQRLVWRQVVVCM